MIEVRWKPLVLIAVGMFLAPAILGVAPSAQGAASAPMYKGDVIYAEANHNDNEKKKKNDLPGWDHAALYIGNYRIVEADPHMENWTDDEKKGNYPFNRSLVRKLHYRSYHAPYDQNHYGKVEYSPLSEITSGEYYQDFLYAWVKVKQEDRDQAVDWAEIRAKPQWPRLNSSTKNYSRPFDYLSPWIVHSKQYENWDDPDKITEWQMGRLRYGYYCSELVWAAYRATARIDLDGHPFTPVVWPSDIEASSYTVEYEP